MQLSLSRLRGGFWIKALWAMLPVAVTDVVLFQSYITGGTFGFIMLAMAAALFLARPAVRRDWRALAALGLATLYGFAMVNDPGMLALGLFLIAISVATLLPAFARFGGGLAWLQRLLVHGLTSVIGLLLDAFALRKVRHRRTQRVLRISGIIAAIALPVIGSGIILGLFAAANPVIENTILAVHWPTWDEETLLRVIIAGVVFSVSWAILRPRLSAFLNNPGRSKALPALSLPGISVVSVTLSLIAFNLLFLMQNGMDAAWLWGFAPLPDDMTLAEYAHRGAYPLIATAIFAAIFVLVTLRPGSETAASPIIRRLVVLWIAQNVFLVASSMLRTVDYIEAYSLTELRLYALVWMALVGVGLLLICWRMLAGKSGDWLVNGNLIAAGLVLTSFCFIDASAVAAQWNVRHAREIDGTGAALDVSYLERRGDAALLPLVELSQKPLPAAVRSRVLRALGTVYRGAQNRNATVRWWSLTRDRRLAEANRLLGPDYAPLVPTYESLGPITAPLTAPKEQ